MPRFRTTPGARRRARRRRALPRHTASVLALVGLLAIPAGPAPAASPLEPLPGARPHPPALRARLAEALASRDPATTPRTRNLHPDGSPRFANRLLLEASPYLLQHAYNPVDWYPWGDEAFEAARALRRPVLVSIGYSTCHWCHVMEEESFDDPEVAAYLNANFIAIKVDRELRPDVDSVYMAALLAMRGDGGWPLNVFVTPDRKPFYAGTYFPPRNRGSRLAFSTVLETLVGEYRDDPDRIAAVAATVSERIAEQLADAAASESRVPKAEVVARARDALVAEIDPTWGGIGRGAKFPSNVPVVFLLRTSTDAARARTHARVERTLERMAAGGIHDQIGGGFHRYATDPRWRIPHFEKMLYDNALISRAYVEAYAATGRTDFAAVARKTLDYVAAEMTAPGGGFYSASDADSPAPSGEREEGRYYTWTPDEVRRAVGEKDAALVIAALGVEENGPVGGRSVLHRTAGVEDLAERFERPPSDVRDALSRGAERMRAARAKRPPPLRDEKILTAWNGLMIAALARAGAVLDEPEYTRAAARAADFLIRSVRRDDRLLRVYTSGRAEGPAFLADYAFLIAGLLELFEADGDPRWLREAVGLQATLDRHYADEIGGGYFQTADDHEALLAREKPDEDGALPSGNSVAAQNLLRLAELTVDPAYTERAVMLLSAFHDLVTATPARLPEMLLAIDWLHATAKEVVLIEPSSGAGAEAMRSVLRSVYAPRRVVVAAREGDGLRSTAALVPYLDGKTARGGRTTAYVCENQVCRYPTTDPERFAEQLRQPPTPAGAP